MTTRAVEVRDLGAAPPQPQGTTLRQATADFWLRLLFRLTPRFPGALRRLRGPLCAGAFRCSRAIRTSTTTNARRILGPAASDTEVQALARRTLENFYSFCCDVCAAGNHSVEDLLSQLESVEGHDHFLAARAAGRGVIVVTAHMGSFEVGMAALRQIEPTIHVVFRRDADSAFEESRSALRQRLGVIEAPVDEGWTVWMRLREALLRNEAVVLQGDRVMPGQKGEPVPFLGGHLLLPTGPVKLSLATGAPIIPIFSLRTPGGKLRVVIEPQIEPDSKNSNSSDRGARAALLGWAQILERYIKAYPEQWLMLQPALFEDEKVNGGGGEGVTG